MKTLTPASGVRPAQPLSLLTASNVDWLWRHWLALGKPALLDGDPEIGKSLVTLDLCARITTGRPFPDGSSGFGPANVLILNAEDNMADTVVPRLKQLGADVDRVFNLDGESADGKWEPLEFPVHAPRLEAALAQTQAKLVVIDPLVAFLGRGINTANDKSVRQALRPVVHLGLVHQAAMLFVRHLNKGSSGRALYRGGGSIGFAGLCRFVSLIAADPDHPERRILAQVKNNLCPRPSSLAFTVGSSAAGGPAIDWQGTSDLCADALVVTPVMGRPASARDPACRFLEELLRKTPMTSHEIWEEAKKNGFSERTIRRAKEDLGIICELIVRDGRRLSYWRLPDKELPEELRKYSPAAELEPWLAPIRAMYPSASPIDG